MCLRCRWMRESVEAAGDILEPAERDFLATMSKNRCLQV
jgi:hypothetical protein